MASTINSMLISKLEYIQNIRKSSNSSSGSGKISSINSFTSTDIQMSTFDKITNLEKQLDKLRKKNKALNTELKKMKKENDRLVSIIELKTQKEKNNKEITDNQSASNDQQSSSE